jgi:hypothetical protein
MGKSPGFPADQSLSYFDLERRAQKIRALLALDPVSPLPGLRLFESLDRYAVRFGDREFRLEYAVGVLAPGVEAEARFEEEELTLTLSEETYRDLEEDRPRARFSLSHELGHVVSHAAQLRRLARIPHSEAALQRARVPNHPPYRDTEWQANGFAAALLMPAPALKVLEDRKQLFPVVLAAEMRVSREAASNRIYVYEMKKEDLIRAYMR